MKTLTHTQATKVARDFIREFVKPGRQWSIATLERSLPAGWTFDEYSDYSGPATVADLALFIRREARPE